MHDRTSVPLQELISRSARGEQEAFRSLVEQQQSYVFALAFRILCDRDDAEDVVQETFIRVWGHLRSYDPAMKFTTWLYKIAVHLAYDRLKARKRRRWLVSLSTADLAPPESAPNEEEGFAKRDLADHIKGMADNLPLKQRLVFSLRDLQDLSIEEVGQILSMSAGTVKANLCYARQSIRKKMRKLDAVEGTTP
jgi:RNA polymerase sigma-70 factor, ECF subfamily